MLIDPETIQLTEHQRAVLADVADRAGMPWEEVLAEALRSYRPSRSANGNGSAPGSFFDSMSDVIGVVKNSPADLSVNPDYLDGFGRDREIGPA